MELHDSDYSDDTDCLDDPDESNDTDDSNDSDESDGPDDLEDPDDLDYPDDLNCPVESEDADESCNKWLRWPSKPMTTMETILGLLFKTETVTIITRVNSIQLKITTLKLEIGYFS